MSKYSVPYGKGFLQFKFPVALGADVIMPIDVPAASDPIGEVEYSLAHPVDGLVLEKFHHAKRVAIAINDKTRPVPHHQLLPPILRKLETIGIHPDDIVLLIATGTHQPHTQVEISGLLPAEIINRYQILSHDADDTSNLVYLGTTLRGTPVHANKIFMQADLRIVCGNIEPHHFMGFSGGVKSAAIGLAGRETITKNHSWLLHPCSIPGEYHRNETRQDVEEIGQMMDIHYAVNVVLNNSKQIVRSFSGSPVGVMSAGMESVIKNCQTLIADQYDIVIASPGGHPKDINFYQAQKAITHASLITRDGGTLILVAACPEGIGSDRYERFMYDLHSHQEVLEKFKNQGFEIGPHKAVQIAMRALKMDILVVSAMDPKDVRLLLLNYAPTLDQAIQSALHKRGENPRIAILPKATNTMPVLVES